MNVGTSFCAKAPRQVTPKSNCAHVVQTTRAVHRDSDLSTLKGGASLNETDTGDNGNLSHQSCSSFDIFDSCSDHLPLFMRAIATLTETALVDAHLLPHPSPTCSHAELELCVRFSSRRASGVPRWREQPCETPQHPPPLFFNEPFEIIVETNKDTDTNINCTTKNTQ